MMDCTEERSSLFTTSGSGFCFDYLCPIESHQAATPAKVKEEGKEEEVRKEGRKRSHVEIEEGQEGGSEEQKTWQKEFLSIFKKEVRKFFLMHCSK